MNTKNNEWITLERELAAKDAEIARLTAVGPVSGASESDVYQWLRDAQARITELERQLAEAGEDKARLDWLDKEGCWFAPGRHVDGYARIGRAAIDTARKANQCMFLGWLID